MLQKRARCTIFDYTDNYTVASSSLTFYLNGKYVYCQYYASDGRFQSGINLKVDPERFRAGKYTKDQAALMRRLQGLIDQYEGNARQANNPTLVSEVEYIILTETGKKPKIRTVKDSLFSVYTRFIEGVKAGEILNKGVRYSDSWIGITEAITPLLESMPAAQLPVAGVREEHLHQCVSLFSSAQKRTRSGKAKGGMSKNTVATYMAVLVGILNRSRRMGWYSAPLLDAKAFKTGWEDIDHGVYLTIDELKKIEQLPYEGEQAMWRDAFLLGCNLGLRFSDLSRITPKHRRDNLIKIRTTKTKTDVWLPLSSQAQQILNRYPTISITNEYGFLQFIKKMGEAAGFTKQVLFSRTEGGIKIEKWVHRYELMGTHTMRRSLATNMFKAGVDTASIMKITGHKSEVTFKKYLRLSDEEHAILLSGHPFFK